MATQDQSLSAGAGLPAPAATRPEAIKAIPVRHWGRWISCGASGPGLAGPFKGKAGGA
jgi:hypothetical protein